MCNSAVQGCGMRARAWLLIATGLMSLALSGCSRDTDIEVKSFEVTPTVAEPAPNGPGLFEITFDIDASEDSYYVHLTWVPRGETDQNSPNQVASISTICSPAECPLPYTWRCRYSILETDSSRRALQCAQGSAYRFEVAPGEYTLIASFETGLGEFKKFSSAQVLTDMSLR